MIAMRPIGNTDIRVSKIGLGTVSFGGLYSPTTQDMANEAVHTCLDSGVNYFDTAPLYGYGEAEKRLGVALQGIRRDQYVVSTKVGRVLDPISEEANAKRNDWFVNPAAFEPRDDYTRDGIIRSFESSLERLQLDHVDIVYVHYGQISSENTSRIIDESYPVLADLRSQGVVKAIGMGMDLADPLVHIASQAHFDVFMLAFRYNLLDWSALDELLPLCQKNNVSVVIAAPYTGGILAMDDLSKSPKYMYRDAPPEIIAQAQRIKNVCDHHGVPMRAVALQFGLGHPAVASTVPGGRNGDEVRDNVHRVEMDIPDALWDELADEGLLPTNVPHR